METFPRRNPFFLNTGFPVSQYIREEKTFKCRAADMTQVIIDEVWWTSPALGTPTLTCSWLWIAAIVKEPSTNRRALEYPDVDDAVGNRRRE